VFRPLMQDPFCKMAAFSHKEEAAFAGHRALRVKRLRGWHCSVFWVSPWHAAGARPFAAMGQERSCCDWLQLLGLAIAVVGRAR
jgi:hypothetical protein